MQKIRPEILVNLTCTISISFDTLSTGLPCPHAQLRTPETISTIRLLPQILHDG